MSDISITGNEAQFNENVTFLKDVNIGGFLSLPDQNLDLNNLSITGQISGNPNLSISAGFLTVTTDKIKISGFTTFMNKVEFKDDVLFNNALSFPILEVRDEFRVGSGGTVITADSFLNPGRVGIGSSAPTELLDVGGKAKIIDLDLRNLNVAGFSTFNNNIDVNANVDISGSLDVNNHVSIGQTLGVAKEVTIGNTLNVSGISTFEDNVKITGTGNLQIEGSGPQLIQLLDDTGADGIRIAYRTTSDEFTIENQADSSKFFLADRDNGQVELYNSNVKRLETTGVGITVFGDIIVPDVGIRTSRVGLGTTNPVYITNQLNDAANGTLRLAIDGSLAITRNIYDSAGSPGENGFFLNRDANGIRWVSFEPAFTEGIFIQDEGSFIPTVGAAQSFTIINFVRKNSDGEGTDTLIPTASNPNTQTGLATIFTQDFWGFEGSDIYRMTNVGIGSSFPNVTLDVVGISSFTGVTTSIGALFANKLSVSGVSTFVGMSTFKNNIFVDGTTSTNRLNVVGLSTFVGISTFESRLFSNTISNIGIITSNVIHLTGATYSAPVQSPGDTKSDAAIVVNENFHIYTLEVGGRRLRNLIEKTDDKITIGEQNTSLINSIELKPGSGTVRLHYGDSSDNVKFETSGIGATVYGQLDTINLNVAGLSTFQDDIFVGVGATVGFGTTAYFRDNAKAVFGNDENLSVYHDGSNAFIDNTIGRLFIRDNGFGSILLQPTSGENSVVANASDSVELYFNASKKIETTNEGILVSGGTTTGDFKATGISTFIGVSTFSSNIFVEATTDTNQLNVTGVSTFKDDVEFHGVSGITSVFFDQSDNSLNFVDNARLKIGDSGDLQLYHNALNSWILDQGTGVLVLGTNGEKIRLSKGAGAESLAEFRIDSSVDLYYDDTQRFSTSGIGATVFGQLDTTDLNVTGVSTFQDDIFVGVGATVGFGTTAYFRDNAKAVFGNDEDLVIYHSGDNSVIRDQGAGALVIQGQDVSIQDIDNNATMALFTQNGSVDLHFNGEKRVETTNEGILVSGGTTTGDFKATGVSTFSGTVDIDSTVKDRNDSVGTTVAENLSNDITDASYNSTTGIMVITIANHGFVTGDSIQIPDGTITFSCNYGGGVSSQSYPRSKDPNSGKWLVITKINDNSFSVDVGDGGLAAGITHNFVSASGGVLHSSGQYVEYDYRLASVGTGVSWRPSGVQTKRTIWVSKSGSDSNSGLLEGDAKATIGAAASIAVETDTIKIRPGLYIENNPIGLRTDVSVTGEDLRLVTVQSKNKNKDVFHVRRGCLIENLNFGGSNVGVSHAGAACVAFPTPAGSDSAVTGYTEPGPATEGPSGRWRSPYVRNCTNFMTDSIGLKVDGDNATASTVGGDLKSMVVDSYTQYNENGIGVSLTNNGYAQLVSIFTISCDIGIFASSGAQCDLTNSNSSFGNFGLVAVGLGSTQFTGIVSNTNVEGEIVASTSAEGQDTVVCANVRDFDSIERRPFDGQALFFKINVNNYPDVNLNNLNAGTIDGDNRITTPLEQVRSISLIATGSDLEGFSAIDPPSVLIRDADGEVEPKGPQGIIAEAVADVDATGKLVGVDVIAQGRNYFSGQNIVVDIEGNTGLATAVMEPIFFTVESSTENAVGSIGIATVTFNEFIPYELFPDDPFSLQRISRILTSSHSFEYVGAGTDINISTPLQGAIPIKANEIVAKDGAQIPFTSTDQQGNFDIGQGLQINQTTSSITGRDFSRSIQAQVTPLILALR